MPTADTIAAIATAPGRGGVGIVRISGPAVPALRLPLFGIEPAPRLATVCSVRGADQTAIDSGLALYFAAPASYTGEAVLEFHGHGGPVVLDAVLARVLALGVRHARPGEFTERAYLNGKLDLAQAEAVADLIDAGSAEAARAATATLQGAFGDAVNALARRATELRVYVEAAIDFPDEDIDFLADGVVRKRLGTLRADLHALRAQANEGRALNEGLTVVIAGLPNAGKSSLLNQLARADAAIVTSVAGTTRDLLRERVVLDGLPLTLVDTAGLRDTDDPVEQIGVARAQAALREADCVLWVDDETQAICELPDVLMAGAQRVPIIRLRNKADATGLPAGSIDADTLRISAKTGAGLDALAAALKARAGLSDSGGNFSARRRHLRALDQAAEALAQGDEQLAATGSGELLAEDLRAAHDALGTITGHTDSEALLGEIFSSFCIGK